MNQPISGMDDEDAKIEIASLIIKQVTQDICIQHYRFNFKPHKVPKQEMKGKPTSVYKIIDILKKIKSFSHTDETGVELNFSSFSFERDGRYGRSIESINIKNNDWIELVISTTDFQAENFFKEDKVSKKQEYVSFSKNQGAKRFSHVLINIDQAVGSKGVLGNVYLEANKGVTAYVFKKMFELILLRIKELGVLIDLFEEVYRPDVTKKTKMNLEIKVSISPMVDQSVLNKILTNDYMKLQLRDRWLQEPASDEVDFLEQTEEVKTFVPTGILNTPLTAEKFTQGVTKLIKEMRKGAKAKEKTSPTIHLTYFEGERERTVELDLQHKLADVASKKTWLKDFNRKPITKESFIDENLFNTIISRVSVESKQKN